MSRRTQFGDGLLKNSFLVTYVYSESTAYTKFLAKKFCFEVAKLNYAKLCYKLGLVLLYYYYCKLIRLNHRINA